MSLLLLAALLLCPQRIGRAAPQSSGDWAEILRGAPAALPEPQKSVRWRGDLPDALREAKEQNRPLFVTLRCLPCKQCSAFDKNVLEGGAELDPLLKQFVTVRLTDAQAVDLRLLPMEGFQDFDLSWWGWLLSPEGKIYSVFGGRDEVSDETRISVPALAAMLKRVLDHHYDPRPQAHEVDGPAPTLDGDPKTPKDLPGYASWHNRGGEEVKKATCIHCHQVAEILRQPAVDLKQFDKTRDFDVWPLPENVGITVDRDHGLLVTKVTPGSAADQAGLKPGDELAAAGGRRLFSQADFRGVLHRGPRGAGAVDVAWLRDGAVQTGTFQVPDGWRKTILDWRMSVSQGNVGAGPDFFPLAFNEAKRKARSIPAGTMAVEPYLWPKSNAQAAGLRGNDCVIAVDGESPDVAGRGFLVWFRQHHEPGDDVTLTVKDAQGGERKVTYRLAAGG
jgi:hypothetical protein